MPVVNLNKEAYQILKNIKDAQSAKALNQGEPIRFTFSDAVIYQKTKIDVLEGR